MCLPPRLIGKGIENTKRRRPDADGKPRPRRRLGFYQGQSTAQEGRHFILLSGLGL